MKSAHEAAGDRIALLKKAVREAPPTICPERALLWTEYCRRPDSRAKHVYLRMAEALAHFLAHKTVRIHPHELLVGNFTSHRVGGHIAPELHGIASLFELGSFPKRKANPLQISRADIRALRRLIPFWLTRNLPYQTHSSPLRSVRFFVESYRSRDWIINELGGIAHFTPDYARLIDRGAEGLIAEARERQARCDPHSDSWAFYEAACVIAEALARFGERYAEHAAELARSERDPNRRSELEQIALVCRRVPRHGARTLYEALQSVLLAQIAIVNEGLEVSICPGRMDRYLFPFYRADVDAGRLTREQAKELLACFSIKLCETVPVFSTLPNRANSGLPSYQTLVVGGVDCNGDDAVNELSYIFLEIMDELRMRQPNFQARIHARSPAAYLDRVYAVLADGANSPAVYNDEVIVPALVKYGHTMADARDYAPVGCVEPTCQGKSFASTDAVLFNTPAVLELALNEGKRFGGIRRTGAKTKRAADMRSMDDVAEAFSAQLRQRLATMIADLRAVERANAAHRPTPLSSALIDGCLQTGKCSTRGGAAYNRSGIQCVGVTDVGDSLRAIEQLVFVEKRLTLVELVAQLKRNLPDEATRTRLRRAAKFGNDDEAADRWTMFVVDEFVRRVESFGESTRGGRYVVGLYSTTAHDHFGRLTGALPNGRRRGEPFTSGIAPANGADREGPTAVINSMNRLDFSRCPNGINFNVKFQADVVRGESGRNVLQSLMGVYFARGGMQAQINVLDAETLRRAKQAPELFPNLLIRVSGYSAYFNDLSEAMKDEIIARTSNTLG
jgi:formate C-acetyltransferase